ncbi:hypothetical protein RhiirA4_546791 [Rhizophagus irregularis]|uniref:Ubiquitin-like domain-containing protein n=1 Tax=Rhizophagus irregularis TaxID=588596 RepID=A0A2I1GYZ8_9GLOM|nr:hypothetical protein RhiirA4_546791 [Rhizophagus irregularis]
MLEYVEVQPTFPQNHSRENNAKIRMQAITIRKNEGYSELKVAIQSRLGAPFDHTPLKIWYNQAGSVIEKLMDPYDDTISNIFTEEPKAEHFHIIVYPAE